MKLWTAIKDAWYKETDDLARTLNESPGIRAVAPEVYEEAVKLLKLMGPYAERTETDGSITWYRTNRT